MSRMTRRPALWAKWMVVAGLLGAAPVSLLAQTLDTNPEFDVGDKWTYRFHNKGDRREPYLFTNQAYKSEAGSGWLFMESQEPNSRRPNAIFRFDYKRADVKESFDFNAKNPRVPGNRYSNRQPADDWIQMPLSVGKKYSVTENWSNGEGHTKFDAEVESFEKVKVEAGEFDAYRIKLQGWWNRTANGSGSGRAGYTVWFAPAVKRLIKREYFDRNSNGSPWSEQTTELVKWEPKAELAPALAASVPPAAPAPAPAPASSAPN